MGCVRGFGLVVRVLCGLGLGCWFVGGGWWLGLGVFAGVFCWCRWVVGGDYAGVFGVGSGLSLLGCVRGFGLVVRVVCGLGLGVGLLALVIVY